MSDDFPETPVSDDFQETRMSIGEHLEEMRSHLIRALLWLALIMTICLQFQEKILEIATWPHRKTMLAIVEANQYDKIRDLLPSDELEAVQEVIERKKSLNIAHEDLLRNDELLKRKFANIGDGDLQALSKRQQKIIDDIIQLNKKQRTLLEQSDKDIAQFTALQKEVVEKSKQFQKIQDETQQAERLIDRRAKRANVKVRLQQLSYPEAFMSYLKVSFVLALFIAGPFMGREAWKFVAKGLYPEEKRWVTVISPLSFIAFFSGAAFGYFILIPLGLHYLATYGGEDIIEGSITLSEYLSIFITLTLVVGLFFQLPLIMSFTTLIHLTTDQTFRERRRWFYFIAVIVSAFLTPPDPVTQVLMWIPLLILYELGIWLSYIIVRGRAQDTDIPPPPSSPDHPDPDKPGPNDSPPVIDSSGPAAIATESPASTEETEQQATPTETTESSKDAVEPEDSEKSESETPEKKADEEAKAENDEKTEKPSEDSAVSQKTDENKEVPESSRQSEADSEAKGSDPEPDADSNWEDEVYPDEWYEELDEDEEYLDTDGYQDPEGLYPDSISTKDAVQEDAPASSEKADDAPATNSDPAAEDAPETKDAEADSANAANGSEENPAEQGPVDASSPKGEDSQKAADSSDSVSESEGPQEPKPKGGEDPSPDERSTEQQDAESEAVTESEGDAKAEEAATPEGTAKTEDVAKPDENAKSENGGKPDGDSSKPN